MRPEWAASVSFFKLICVASFDVNLLGCPCRLLQLAQYAVMSDYRQGSRPSQVRAPPTHCRNGSLC